MEKNVLTNSPQAERARLPIQTFVFSIFSCTGKFQPCQVGCQLLGGGIATGWDEIFSCKRLKVGGKLEGEIEKVKER